MSSARWPAGTLSSALRRAHQLYPTATAPQLAREVGCDPGCARVVLRGMKLHVPKGKVDRVTWSPEMKSALIRGAHERRPIGALAEELGVAPQTLALGALETIRDLVAQQ